MCETEPRRGTAEKRDRSACSQRAARSDTEFANRPSVGLQSAAPLSSKLSRSICNASGGYARLLISKRYFRRHVRPATLVCCRRRHGEIIHGELTRGDAHTKYAAARAAAVADAAGGAAATAAAAAACGQLSLALLII